MATTASFTPEELALLRDVIPLAGFAVAVAGNSGIIGTFKEATATVGALKDAAKEYPQNELIQALLTDLQQHQPRMPHYDPLEVDIQVKIKNEALEKCRQALTLLSQKATPQEVRDFKDWLVATSERVANAAKEGSFLGFGGQRVSGGEAAVLKELQEILKS